MPTAAMIVIGNEILSGRTRDANIQLLGQRLGAAGIALTEARVISDDTAAIVDAVRALTASHDHVFTSGGIGPTHDDITAAAVAAAFERPVARHPEAERRLRAYYAPEEQNAARMRMADLPDPVDALIDNPVSQAPGFRIGNLHVMAGVPRIFEAMIDAVVPTLTGGAPIVSRAVSAFLREGDMAEGLTDIQKKHPEVDLGSYPFVRDGRLGVSIVARGTEVTSVNAAIQAVADMMRALGATPEASVK